MNTNKIQYKKSSNARLFLVLITKVGKNIIFTLIKGFRAKSSILTDSWDKN